MSQFVESLKDQCKKISQSLQISKFDMFGVIKEENSASAKENKPFALSASNKSSVTLRVWNEHDHMGSASTSNLTPEGLARAFEIALNSTQFSDTAKKYDFSSLCLEKIDYNLSNSNCDFESIQNLAHAVIECEKNILASHPSFKSVPYNKIAQTYFEQFYFNSLNSFRYQKTSYAMCYFYPLAHEDNKIPRQLGHVSLADNFKNLNYLECAHIAVEKTKKYLNYEKVTSGNYSVLFSPEAFLDLVGAFSNFFNAQNILDNKSLCTKETLNTQLASNLIHICDSPLHKDNVTKSYFDEEGTPTSKLTIVENGVLKNLIHTSYTAKIFNTKPTGHSSIKGKLTAQSHFLHVFASKESSQKFPIHSEPYIYIEDVKALHAGINALQGSFSLPFDGFFVHGEKSVSIESATVAGDFLTLLKNIIFVSQDEKVTPSGVCPEVLVSNLSITGV